MRNQALFASIILSSLLVAGAADAADGYVTDSSGAVVRSGNGLCWKTGYWTPGMATAECDPDLAPKPKAAERPATKVAAPAPAPVPAKPAAETTTLAADGLFAFGKATLLPKGKAKLDEVIGKIKGRSADQILVVGHTDRIGSPQANLRLSQKRAQAVKAYLVSRKVDKRLIQVEGKGSAEPVTTAGQCPGKGGAKVIACLAPDRRVEIRVIGLK
ncbi:MAG TPA: OmpA family protein [Rhodocyclaceae bacterium]|nr:OmpA family protein [Rhodocyclaceae bacterium]